MIINDSRVTVCMAEPDLYQIFDQETKLLAKYVHPDRVLLGADKVRTGGTCAACRGRNMGELLGEGITRQDQMIHRYLPGAEVYVWSDVLDPNHNAHSDCCLVNGDFTGSWRHVPKDIVIAVWGGAPRPKSLEFFAGGDSAPWSFAITMRMTWMKQGAGSRPLPRCQMFRASCTRPGRRNTRSCRPLATCSGGSETFASEDAAMAF